MFSHGISPKASNALLNARDAELPWETLVCAVADGLSVHHHGPPIGAVPHAQRGRPAWQVGLIAVAIYVLLRPVLGLGHELSVCGMARLQQAMVDTGFWQPLIGWLGLDPIYAGAAVRAAGGVQVAGLAVGGPLGEWLHALVPWAILSPDHLAPDAGISMVAAPGAPALGRGLAGFGADVLWLTVSVWLARAWRERGAVVGLLGLLLQAQIVVNHLLDANVSLPDLEASGLPFALAVAVPNGPWFTAGLEQAPEPWRTLVIGGSLVVLGYACAGLILLGGAGIRRLLPRRNRGGPIESRTVEHRLLMAGMAAAIVTAISPIGALAVGESNWTGVPLTALAGSRALVPSGTSRRNVLRPPPAPSKTAVRLEQRADGSWQYLVNGQPDLIRGVGYNPQYAALGAAARGALYQRDFGAMRALGVNTIEGWFENQFDSVTLDYAARNGIGVLIPFELNQDWPYENPNVQQSILDHVSAQVERYKNQPAVRMWAPGNEDLHRMLYPRWVSQENNTAARARADAFAAFLPVLVDRIHELDPDHPVIYRDAEDVYLPRLKAAFLATGVERPWLVYGANVYSQARLQQIVAAWPSQWVGGPLVLSEFAPGGVGPTDRPLGFEQDWAIIRSRPDIVIGGLAYTWATNGPEELDRVFGLVNDQGIPSDGALAALSATYLADLTQTASSGPPG